MATSPPSKSGGSDVVGDTVHPTTPTEAPSQVMSPLVTPMYTPSPLSSKHAMSGSPRFRRTGSAQGSPSLYGTGAGSFWPSPLNRMPADGFRDLRETNRDLLAELLQSGVVRAHTVTFNMMGRPPPEDLVAVVPRAGFHVVAVASQESTRSIRGSLLRPSKAEWEDQLQAHLGLSYVKLAGHALAAIHLVVFLHEQLLPIISDVQSAACPCDKLKTGAKGAVGVSFNLGQTSCLFVSAHLEAHQRSVAARNRHYHRIETTMPLCPCDMTHEAPRMSDRFDRVFWLGDFNYRINGSRAMVDELLRRRQHEVLLANDQLLLAQSAGEAFPGFAEGPLNFRPTYNFDVGTLTYDTSVRQRVPSWTDRILFRPPDGVRLVRYDSVLSVRTSDHLPVVASFEVGLIGRASRHRPGFGEAALGAPVTPLVSPEAADASLSVGDSSSSSGGGGGGGSGGGGGGGGGHNSSSSSTSRSTSSGGADGSGSAPPAPSAPVPVAGTPPIHSVSPPKASTPSPSTKPRRPSPLGPSPPRHLGTAVSPVPAIQAETSLGVRLAPFHMPADDAPGGRKRRQDPPSVDIGSRKSQVCVVS